ncbi:LysR family transcriptional regulator [Tersicoccus solisilvae]|uniref:LysR family transcriptional regulator n=1 Tax=Tersicoccus solisilvae TaxID=1882339 RepID=A0ABQ1P668_9MICC|nr:NAD-dependent epimerase/dehydratase family protein [Tersicoccus solisilvae]GGC91877.1 LysR family transcriptional regulator [Tersicoccus solisilvae]
MTADANPNGSGHGGGRVVVLGGSGLLGTRAAEQLAARGHAVVRVSRATGVDATTGAGLAEAFAGASAVVDCLNIATTRRGPAVDFFTGTATRIADAARTAGVGHVVCLSIVNVTEPALRSALGYYAGKAAQDDVYRRRLLGTDVGFTSLRSTQWFEFAEQLLRQIRIGPLAVVPVMRVRPVAADAVAEAIADMVDEGPPSAARTVDVAGPEVMDTGAMARRLAEARGTPAVATVPMPRRALRTGGLLPPPDARIDRRTFAEWAARHHA